MKIKFNSDLDFQADAVAAVVDLFEGQEICETNFAVAALDSTARPNRFISRCSNSSSSTFGFQYGINIDDLLCDAFVPHRE